MTEYRDMTKAYTDEELQGLTDAFKSLPTWDGTKIKATDIPELIKKMKYERTPEQVAAYQNYWEQNCDGKVTLEEFLSSAKAVHDTSLYAMDYVKLADKDNDGFINAVEFKEILNLMISHCTKVQTSGKTYQDFVNEADINHDGKVSLEECAKWMRDRL